MSDGKISRARLLQAAAQFEQAVQEEEAARAKLRRIYDQLCLDADSETVLKSVRQIFFRLYKKRLAKQIEERLEFHPFYVSESSDELNEEEGFLGFDEEDELGDDNDLV